MKIPGDNLIIGRDNPFTLLVAQSQAKTASGSLFWDDGDSIEMKSYNYLKFSLSKNVLTIDVPVRNYNTTMRLEIIKILGVDQPVGNVKINEKSYTEFLYNIPDQVD